MHAEQQIPRVETTRESTRIRGHLGAGDEDVVVGRGTREQSAGLFEIAEPR